jgi:uncharacterized protein YecT (DUF1311 family)
MHWKNTEINTAVLAILTISVGLISMTSAHAEIKDYYSECADKYTSMNNSVVYECSGYADEKYKKVINASYNKIYKALKSTDPNQAAALEKSQIGWLDYRNNYCSLAGSYIGSPMHAFCPQELNKNRAEELDTLADSF